MASKNGGPAYPCDHRYTGHNGMTLRDYFAWQALAGMLSDNAVVQKMYDAATEAGVDVTTWLAEGSYEQADAMLAAREDTTT